MIEIMHMTITLHSVSSLNTEICHVSQIGVVRISAVFRLYIRNLFSLKL